MIEVVAIDDSKAEAELLRLAASFCEARLFVPKQTKKLDVVVEVSSQEARACSREQLAAKPALMGSSKFHFTFSVSLLHGFEHAVLQMMHEMAHISQIVHNRYQLASKKTKIDGEKRIIYRARWCGKKMGLVDDIEWRERPWEQEAAMMSQRLTSEFMGLIYGTQSDFAAELGKKRFLLHPVQFALPTMPNMPTPNMPPPDMPTPDMPTQNMPQFGMPEVGMPESKLEEEQLADIVSDPLFGQVPPSDAFSDAPNHNLSNHDDAGQSVSDDALFADIDAMLAADTASDTASARPNSMTDGAFGDQIAQVETTEQTASGATDETKLTYVSGVLEPRQLKLSVLRAKQKELADRGLLENSAK